MTKKKKKIIYVDDDTQIEIRCTGAKKPTAANWRESNRNGRINFRVENYQVINFYVGHHPEINLTVLKGDKVKQLSVVNNR